MLRPARSHPLLVVLLAVLAGLAVSALPADATPLTRSTGASIEVFSPYQPQSSCNPTPKPGTLALSRLVTAAYPGTGSLGIARDCASGGLSEHKEGRAWDWQVVYSNPRQRAQAADFLHWLFATDSYGNTFAEARRLGVMYVIWNHRIWGAYSASSGWRPYSGSDPHTSHMHISLSWAGALKKTSYWTGAVAPVLQGPHPPKPSTSTPHPVTVPPVLMPPALPTQHPDPAPAPVPTDPQAPVDQLPVLAVGEGAVDVPADTEGLTTPFQLRADQRYLLTVTGTYAYGAGPMQADAECSRWPRDLTWHRHSQWEGSTGSGHLDLTVQDSNVAWTPQVDDGRGCDSTTHTYTLVVRPSHDGPLRLAVRDDNRSDNHGALHVVVRPFDGTASD